MRNLQEQVKKTFCYQKLFWPFTVQTNCSKWSQNFCKLLASSLKFEDLAAEPSAIFTKKVKLFQVVFFERMINGILLPKLFWPTVRENCSSDREKLLKFEAGGWEFANILKSLQTICLRSDQFLVTECFFILFLEVFHIW